MQLERCEKGHIFNVLKDKTCPYCILSKEENKYDMENDTVIKTLAYIEENVDPVVAWLVCIEGAERGKEYRLKDGRNFVGSSPNMDVCILGDDKIAKENHFSISYNNKQRIFVISPGSSGNIIYVDKKALYETKTIENFSLIEVCDTKLVLIQFCGDNFSWENNE
ncbi:FHA domain-containing protein [Oceanivirga salmonicida]|uniref:FHA domain-containing protein n=1 Tax=Oceanivirga salmonicida TaxID=1769291 RepID=UPI00082BC2A5|nr:FHA domain-containing protein [Oceanivirga salmonicida]